MATDNLKTTIATYNDEHQTYIEKTAGKVTGSVKMFVDGFLSYLKKDSEILEIGSGAGRDAFYMLEKGFKNIVVSDAAINFVKRLQREGFTATKLDIVNDRLDQTFDAILANAVFLHFDEQELTKAMRNCLAMLRPGGIIAMSFQEGDFRGMSQHKHSQRYFHEWKEPGLKEFINRFNVEIIGSIKGISISKRKNWIILTVRKV